MVMVSSRLQLAWCSGGRISGKAHFRVKEIPFIITERPLMRRGDDAPRKLMTKCGHRPRRSTVDGRRWRGASEERSRRHPSTSSNKLHFLLRPSLVALRLSRRRRRRLWNH